jgi:hypothetical protein
MRGSRKISIAKRYNLVDIIKYRLYKFLVEYENFIRKEILS